MSENTPNETPAEESTGTSFAEQADEAPPGLVAEFGDFLIHNKKWWLAPIIVVLILAAYFAIFGGSAAAPFIYPGI